MRGFDVIPSLDLLGGNVVRLRRGAFNDVTSFGDPRSVLDRLAIPAAARLHIVDLEGARSGKPAETRTVSLLRARGYRMQVGGGIRAVADAQAWINAGAEKIVIGTIAADAPELLARIADAIGSENIIPAIDVQDGEIRVAGWTRTAARSIESVFADLAQLGSSEGLMTDISRDGMLEGPSLALYRRVASMTSMRVIASGGVTTSAD
ncbi:MAG TPA: HisA/HisF-related TIM barrel protein, partial [Thermoanaerobaculia bacterium]